jgi:hypothetical protein
LNKQIDAFSTYGKLLVGYGETGNSNAGLRRFPIQESIIIQGQGIIEQNPGY